jgi:NOL1/NOP2/sun family putative RNA methylase
MANPARRLDHYADLIPEFEDFLRAVKTAPPSHIRVNTLKATPEEVVRNLEGLGFALKPESFSELIFRVEKAPVPLGSTLAHALGLIYMQSASSAVSALALGARPGDRVLDLCAAPGSKTTLIAQMMENTGLIVANEPSHKRITSLNANLRRMGVANTLITCYSGQNYPLRTKFNKILVDAPCSGEGTWRGLDSRPRDNTEDTRDRMTERQSGILRQALEILEEGGELVYSTCTYAPSENELIVAPFIEKYGLRVLPLGLGLPAVPGLTEWQGEKLPGELKNAARLYPHYFDSEGFFVVRLAKP